LPPPEAWASCMHACKEYHISRGAASKLWSHGAQQTRAFVKSPCMMVHVPDAVGATVAAAKRGRKGASHLFACCLQLLPQLVVLSCQRVHRGLCLICLALSGYHCQALYLQSSTCSTSILLQRQQASGGWMLTCSWLALV
jgi:hypothetical protein